MVAATASVVAEADAAVKAEIATKVEKIAVNDLDVASVLNDRNAASELNVVNGPGVAIVQSEVNNVLNVVKKLNVASVLKVAGVDVSKLKAGEAIGMKMTERKRKEENALVTIIESRVLRKSKTAVQIANNDVAVSGVIEAKVMANPPKSRTCPLGKMQFVESSTKISSDTNLDLGVADVDVATIDIKTNR
jgi:hypothetical protein